MTSAASSLPAELKVCARRSWGGRAGACLAGFRGDRERCGVGGQAEQGWRERTVMTAGFGGAEVWEGGAVAPKNCTPGLEAGR